MFIAILDFGTSSADRPRALDQLEGERRLVRSMPGNLAFRVYESREDDRTVTVVHEWTDQSSFVAYLACDTFELLVDRHYVLCASQGALRLEAEGQRWLLPPARAALLSAGRPATVTIPQPATTASVLFHIDFVPPPRQGLTVVDLDPLARALVAECGGWQEAQDPLPPYARAIFAA